MPVTLSGDSQIELRWWWEGPPGGTRVALGDRHAALAYLRGLGRRTEASLALRRFLRAGMPGMALPLGDALVIEELAAALAAGRAAVAETPAAMLSTFGAEQEEPVARPLERVAAEPAAPAEEVCWPCLQAAASARALRAAAEQGAPFVETD